MPDPVWMSGVVTHACGLPCCLAPPGLLGTPLDCSPASARCGTVAASSRTWTWETTRPPATAARTWTRTTSLRCLPLRPQRPRQWLTRQIWSFALDQASALWPTTLRSWDTALLLHLAARHQSLWEKARRDGRAGRRPDHPPPTPRRAHPILPPLRSMQRKNECEPRPPRRSDALTAPAGRPSARWKGPDAGVGVESPATADGGVCGGEGREGRAWGVRLWPPTARPRGGERGPRGAPASATRVGAGRRPNAGTAQGQDGPRRRPPPIAGGRHRGRFRGGPRAPGTRPMVGTTTTVAADRPSRTAGGGRP